MRPLLLLTPPLSSLRELSACVRYANACVPPPPPPGGMAVKACGRRLWPDSRVRYAKTNANLGETMRGALAGSIHNGMIPCSQVINALPTLL